MTENEIADTTENTENTENTETGTPADTGENTETTETTETVERKPDPEAAKYRRRLRETEAQRDALTATLDVYRRRDVELAAEAAGLSRGADLFDAGVNLTDMLGEDGTVDVERVQASVAAVLEARPHWRAAPVQYDIGIKGATATPTDSTWATLLKGSAL